MYSNVTTEVRTQRWIETDTEGSTAAKAGPSAQSHPVSDVRYMDWSSDSKMLVTADQAGTICTWTDEGVKTLTVGTHGPDIRQLKVSTSRNLIATSGLAGDRKSTINLWNTSGGLNQVLAGFETYHISIIKISHVGDILAFASEDRVFHYDLAKQNPNERRFASFEDEVTAVAFSNNDKYYACGLENGVIHLLQVNDPNMAFHAVYRHDDPILSLAFRPDDRMLASGSPPGHQKLLGSNSNIFLWSLDKKNGDRKKVKGHEGGADNLFFSPTGEFLVAQDTVETGGIGRITILSTKNQKKPESWKPQDRQLDGVALSPDFKAVATQVAKLDRHGSKPGYAIHWGFTSVSYSTWMPIEKCEVGDWPSSPGFAERPWMFSPNSRKLAVTVPAKDGQIRVFEVPSH